MSVRVFTDDALDVVGFENVAGDICHVGFPLEFKENNRALFLIDEEKVSLEEFRRPLSLHQRTSVASDELIAESVALVDVAAFQNRA